ncbi:MAG TPA: hypothetical protein VE987_13025 [Polyangiaceae bacterium]|nr:hypothetical protein [Polyangiaceae bacterium]
MMKYSLAVLCLVHLTACGGSPFAAEGLFADAGGELDTGLRPVGPNRDAGEHEAAAPIEAAAPDAGDPPPPARDAGADLEASPPADAGSGDEPTPACAASFSRDHCPAYVLGAEVSKDGRNWTCAAATCANCAMVSSCDPGASGCPWGTVWTDEGPCQ